jgi:hypothetical protein
LHTVHYTSHHAQCVYHKVASFRGRRGKEYEAACGGIGYRKAVEVLLYWRQAFDEYTNVIDIDR